MAPLDNARSKPLDLKVYVTSGAGLDVAWADGHRSHYEFAYLRDHCPCAVCDDERGRRHAAATAPAPALPLYKPKISARAASPVGHYAIQFDFSDGHATGIFSFELLRQICPCEVCRSGRG